MLGSGAVPRPTSFPALTPPARGGKGDLEFSGRWSSALSRGDGSVGPGAAACGGAPMTKQKSFKGRVRARMDKTSESYTAARRQLLAKATTEATAGAETHAAAETRTPEGAAVPAEPPGAVGPGT